MTYRFGPSGRPAGTWLPPERRAWILERYRGWQSLPPEEQQRIAENWRRWRAMSPEERARAREHFRKRGRD